MRTETKWALIASVALFLILVFEKIAGLQSPEKFSTWVWVDLALGFLLFTIVYRMVNVEKRESELNGVMSWREGFQAGAIMTLIFIPLSTLLIFIFLKFVHPELSDMVMKASGDHSGKDPLNNYLRLHLVNAFSFGLIFALIIPLFTKKMAK